jgi:hypothetical protein
VNSTAPANAAYAELHLQSIGNTGQVWFDDVAVTNYGSVAPPPAPVPPVTSGVGAAIANPGFETASAGVPAGWATTNTSGSTVVRSSTVAHAGSASVELGPTAGTISAQPGWSSLINTGPLAAGRHFQATVWAKGTNVTGNPTMAVAWFDINNRWLANSTSLPLAGGSSNWTELGVNTTAPANAAYARVYVQSIGNTGQVWFDDVAVTNYGSVAPPPAPVPPVTSGVGPSIANAGFETASAGVPAGWATTNSSGSTVVRSSSVAHAGGASVELGPTAGTNSAQPGWYSLINTGPLAAGQRFQATVWAKGTKVTASPLLVVAWFDINNVWLGNSQTAVANGTTSWTQLKVSTTAPTKAAYARLSLQSAQNSGQVWFDDVTFSAVS